MGTRMVLEANPLFCLWQLDLKNAFNGFLRAAMALRLAEAPPMLQRLVPFMCALLGPSAPLALSDGWAEFGSTQGSQQGDPLSPAFFCVWLKPHIRWFVEEVAVVATLAAPAAATAVGQLATRRRRRARSGRVWV